MDKIGDFLKAKRIEKQLSIEDVSEALKIRKFYIEAIENNDNHKFVSDAYYRGFLKQYLQLLGEKYEPQSSIYPPELTINIPKEDKTNPSYTWVLISIILLIVVYSICNFLINK